MEPVNREGSGLDDVLVLFQVWSSGREQGRLVVSRPHVPAEHSGFWAGAAKESRNSVGVAGATSPPFHLGVEGCGTDSVAGLRAR